MSNDINLVVSKTHQLEKQFKRLKILRIIAVLSLATVALVAVFLFVATFILPISSVKKEQEETLANISLLNKKLIKYSLIKDRIKNISGIVDKRKDYAKTTSTVLDKLSVDLTVDGMTISEGKFNLVVSGSSLTPIDDFLESVIAIGDRENIIKNLAIKSLVIYAGSEKYTLTIEADTL